MLILHIGDINRVATAQGKQGNLAVNFSRQRKHREFSKFNFLHRENLEFFENSVIKVATG